MSNHTGINPLKIQQKSRQSKSYLDTYSYLLTYSFVYFGESLQLFTWYRCKIKAHLDFKGYLCPPAGINFLHFYFKRVFLLPPLPFQPVYVMTYL